MRFLIALLKAVFGGAATPLPTPIVIQGAPVSAPTSRYLSDRQMALIKKHLPIYQQACGLVQMGPPLIMAGIHYREAEFATSSQVPGGAFQLDPGGVGDELKNAIVKYTTMVCKLYGVPVKDIETDFFTACLVAVHELKSKVRVTTAVLPIDDEALADAFWGYNGRSRHHTEFEQTQKGTMEPHWRWSPYVNNDPKNGVVLRITGTMPDPKDPTKRIKIDRPDPRPGALMIYREVRARQSELA